HLAVGALRADLGAVGRGPVAVDLPAAAGRHRLPGAPAAVAVVHPELDARDVAPVPAGGGPAERGPGLLGDAVDVAVVAPVALPGHRRLAERPVGDDGVGRRARLPAVGVA